MKKSSVKCGSYMNRVSNLLLRDYSLDEVCSIQLPSLSSSIVGSVLTAIGLAAGCALWEKLVWGYPFLFVHGTLSMLVFILGTMFLSFAMYLICFRKGKNSGGIEGDYCMPITYVKSIIKRNCL